MAMKHYKLIWLLLMMMVGGLTMTSCSEKDRNVSLLFYAPAHYNVRWGILWISSEYAFRAFIDKCVHFTTLFFLRKKHFFFVTSEKITKFATK